MLTSDADWVDSGHRLLRRETQSAAVTSHSSRRRLQALPHVPESVANASLKHAASAEHLSDLAGQVPLAHDLSSHHVFTWYWTWDSRSLWYFLIFALLLPTLLVPLARSRGAAWCSIWTLAVYFLVNPLMLLSSKVAVMVLPAPGLLLCMQLSFSTIMLSLVGSPALGCSSRLEIRVEPLDIRKMWRFSIVAFSLLLQIFANLQSMREIPIETMLCMRSILPLILIVPDYFLFGMALPSQKSLGCLCGMAACMSAYAWRELRNVTTAAGMWMALWMSLLVFDATAVKRVMDTVPMSVWTRCYYTNALGLGPLLLVGLTDLSEVQVELSMLSAWDWLVVVTSCVLGVSMCYAAHLVRELFPLQAAAVVTTASKWLALLVNSMMWDQHTPASSTVLVLASLAFGAAYVPPGRRTGDVQAVNLFGKPCVPCEPSEAAKVASAEGTEPMGHVVITAKPTLESSGPAQELLAQRPLRPW